MEIQRVMNSEDNSDIIKVLFYKISIIIKLW